MIQKYYLYFLFLILFSFNLIAQNKTGTIYGIVTDGDSENPIPFVNVVLIKASDSSTVNAATTNKTGRFDIKNVHDGSYLIKLSCIGFHELIIPDIKIGPAGRKLNTGTTSLYSSITDLDEIVVSSKKETFNNSVDRKIYNVDKDIMSKSGSAGDLLQNIPSVSVDIDGNVSLRGNQNVMIMINGKTSPLMDKNSAAVIDELPANSIERIEVITNPSASFKPDGTSGIINIVLKKDAVTGFNSNVTLNVGNDSRYNGNINFNYNPGKLNIFGNYGYRQDYREMNSSENRKQTDISGITSYYDDNKYFHGRPYSNLATLGADYNFDPFNKLTVSGSYFYQNAERSGVGAETYSDANHIATEIYNRNRLSSEMEKEADATLSFTHNFGQKEHDLDFDYKISHSPEFETNNYADIFTIPINVLPKYDDDKIDQTDDKQEVNLKYKIPFSENSSLEAGYSGEFLTSEENLYVDYFNYATNSFVKDLGRSSDFRLNQSLNAIYTTYQNKIGNLGFMAGLRLENALIKPGLVSLDTTITNKYLNLFPTLHLKYKLTDQTSLQLNYSKRVHRPHDEDLNPFPEYQDQRNIRSGNPNLLPEYTHSLEFGLQLEYKNITFIPGIFYRYTTNKFTQVTTQLNDTTFLTTHYNLNSDQAGGLELVVSGSIANLVSTQFSVDGFYDQIDASNLGYNVNSSTWSWSGTFSFNFNVTKSTMFQLNSNFRSSRLTPQGKSNPSYAINCGMRQDLFNERVSLVLTVSNIFNSAKYQNTLDTPALYDHSVRQWSGRIAYLGVTYHFGKSDKQKDKMEYDDNL